MTGRLNVRLLVLLYKEEPSRLNSNVCHHCHSFHTSIELSREMELRVFFACALVFLLGTPSLQHGKHGFLDKYIVLLAQYFKFLS